LSKAHGPKRKVRGRVGEPLVKGEKTVRRHGKNGAKGGKTAAFLYGIGEKKAREMQRRAGEEKRRKAAQQRRKRGRRGTRGPIAHDYGRNRGKRKRKGKSSGYVA